MLINVDDISHIYSVMGKGICSIQLRQDSEEILVNETFDNLLKNPALVCYEQGRVSNYPLNGVTTAPVEPSSQS